VQQLFSEPLCCRTGLAHRRQHQVDVPFQVHVRNRADDKPRRAGSACGSGMVSPGEGEDTVLLRHTVQGADQVATPAVGLCVQDEEFTMPRMLRRVRELLHRVQGGAQGSWPHQARGASRRSKTAAVSVSPAGPSRVAAARARTSRLGGPRLPMPESPVSMKKLCSGANSTMSGRLQMTLWCPGPSCTGDAGRWVAQDARRVKRRWGVAAASGSPAETEWCVALVCA
jgi:hypothetical protein